MVVLLQKENEEEGVKKRINRFSRVVGHHSGRASASTSFANEKYP
jgi:hypothetical protein